MAGRHQVGNRSFGYLDSQLEQLAMNPWCSPERVSVHHLKNKVTDFGADRRPAGTFTSGLEPPEQLETLSVPADYSVRFDDGKVVSPIRENPGEESP